MPTGYTQDLCNKKISFEQYIMTCARGFGACISLRDEPLTPDIPVFEPSSYYKDDCANIKDEIQKLEEIEDVELWYERENNKEYKNSLERYKEKLEVLKHLIKIEGEIWQWQCPPEYESVKTFAQNQLQTTKNESVRGVEYYKKRLNEIQNRDNSMARKELNDRLATLKSRLKNSRSSYKKELKRCEENNKWVSGLIQSINYEK